MKSKQKPNPLPFSPQSINPNEKFGNPFLRSENPEKSEASLLGYLRLLRYLRWKKVIKVRRARKAGDVQGFDLVSLIWSVQSISFFLVDPVEFPQP